MAEQLDHFPVEGWDVVWLAARHEVAINYNFPIYPLGTCVLEIGLERRPRGEPPSAHHICLDQSPRSVADHCYRLVSIEEGLYKLDRLSFSPKLIWIGNTTGKQEGIIVGWIYFIEGDMYREKSPLS